LASASRHSKIKMLQRNNASFVNDKVQPGKLAQSVHDWLVNDIKYKPHQRHTEDAFSKVPTPNQIKEICRHDMIHVWNFLIENVHDAKLVDHAKKNLLM
jgi:hypothetical protein